MLSPQNHDRFINLTLGLKRGGEVLDQSVALRSVRDAWFILCPALYILLGKRKCYMKHLVFKLFSA